MRLGIDPMAVLMWPSDVLAAVLDCFDDSEGVLDHDQFAAMAKSQNKAAGYG